MESADPTKPDHWTYIVVASDISLAIQELFDQEPDIKQVHSLKRIAPDGGVVVG